MLLTKSNLTCSCYIKWLNSSFSNLSCEIIGNLLCQAISSDNLPSFHQPRSHPYFKANSLTLNCIFKQISSNNSNSNFLPIYCSFKILMDKYIKKKCIFPCKQPKYQTQILSDWIAKFGTFQSFNSKLEVFWVFSKANFDVELAPITSFLHGFERDKMTRAIPRGVDGIVRLLIVASKKVGGDEGIRWVFFLIFLFISGNWNEKMA